MNTMPLEGGGIAKLPPKNVDSGGSGTHIGSTTAIGNTAKMGSNGMGSIAKRNSRGTICNANGAITGSASGAIGSSSGANIMGGTTSMGSGTEHRGSGGSYPVLLIFFIILIAVCCGFATVFFHSLLALAGCPLGINGCAQSYYWSDLNGVLLEYGSIYTWSMLLCCSVGILIGLLYAVFPAELLAHVKGGGTTEALIAVACGTAIPVRCGLARLLITSVYLGAGHTLGGEGPTIHLCTSISTSAGYLVGLRGPHVLSILSTLGIVTGIAAAFNCPIAAIVYAMEDLATISGTVSRSMIGIMSVGSVFATLTQRLFFGDAKVLSISISRRVEKNPRESIESDAKMVLGGVDQTTPYEPGYEEVGAYTFHMSSLILSVVIGFLSGAVGLVIYTCLLNLRAWFKSNVYSTQIVEIRNGEDEFGGDIGGDGCDNDVGGMNGACGMNGVANTGGSSVSVSSGIRKAKRKRRMSLAAVRGIRSKLSAYFNGVVSQSGTGNRMGSGNSSLRTSIVKTVRNTLPNRHTWSGRHTIRKMRIWYRGNNSEGGLNSVNSGNRYFNEVHNLSSLPAKRVSHRKSVELAALLGNGPESVDFSASSSIGSDANNHDELIEDLQPLNVGLQRQANNNSRVGLTSDFKSSNDQGGSKSNFKSSKEHNNYKLSVRKPNPSASLNANSARLNVDYTKTYCKRNSETHGGQRNSEKTHSNRSSLISEFNIWQQQSECSQDNSRILDEADLQPDKCHTLKGEQGMDDESFNNALDNHLDDIENRSQCEEFTEAMNNFPTDAFISDINFQLRSILTPIVEQMSCSDVRSIKSDLASLKSDQLKSDEPRSDELNSEEIMADQSKSDQSSLKQPVGRDQTGSDQPMVDHLRPDRLRSDQRHHSNAESVRSEACSEAVSETKSESRRASIHSNTLSVISEQRSEARSDVGEKSARSIPNSEQARRESFVSSYSTPYKLMINGTQVGSNERMRNGKQQVPDSVAPKAQHCDSTAQRSQPDSHHFEGERRTPNYFEGEHRTLNVIDDRPEDDQHSQYFEGEHNAYLIERLASIVEESDTASTARDDSSIAAEHILNGNVGINRTPSAIPIGRNGNEPPVEAVSEIQNASQPIADVCNLPIAVVCNNDAADKIHTGVCSNNIGSNVNIGACCDSVGGKSNIVDVHDHQHVNDRQTDSSGYFNFQHHDCQHHVGFQPADFQRSDRSDYNPTDGSHGHTSDNVSFKLSGTNTELRGYARSDINVDEIDNVGERYQSFGEPCPGTNSATSGVSQKQGEFVSSNNTGGSSAVGSSPDVVSAHDDGYDDDEDMSPVEKAPDGVLADSTHDQYQVPPVISVHSPTGDVANVQSPIGVCKSRGTIKSPRVVNAPAPGRDASVSSVSPKSEVSQEKDSDVSHVSEISALTGISQYSAVGATPYAIIFTDCREPNSTSGIVPHGSKDSNGSNTNDNYVSDMSDNHGSNNTNTTPNATPKDSHRIASTGKPKMNLTYNDDEVKKSLKELNLAVFQSADSSDENSYVVSEHEAEPAEVAAAGGEAKVTSTHLEDGTKTAEGLTTDHERNTGVKGERDGETLVKNNREAPEKGGDQALVEEERPLLAKRLSHTSTNHSTPASIGSFALSESPPYGSAALRTNSSLRNAFSNESPVSVSYESPSFPATIESLPGSDNVQSNHSLLSSVESTFESKKSIAEKLSTVFEENVDEGGNRVKNYNQDAHQKADGSDACEATTPTIPGLLMPSIVGPKVVKSLNKSITKPVEFTKRGELGSPLKAGLLKGNPLKGNKKGPLKSQTAPILSNRNFLSPPLLGNSPLKSSLPEGSPMRAFVPEKIRRPHSSDPNLGSDPADDEGALRGTSLPGDRVTDFVEISVAHSSPAANLCKDEPKLQVDHRNLLAPDVNTKSLTIVFEEIRRKMDPESTAVKADARAHSSTEEPKGTSATEEPKGTSTAQKEELPATETKLPPMESRLEDVPAAESTKEPGSTFKEDNLSFEETTCLAKDADSVSKDTDSHGKDTGSHGKEIDQQPREADLPLSQLVSVKNEKSPLDESQVESALNTFGVLNSTDSERRPSTLELMNSPVFSKGMWKNAIRNMNRMDGIETCSSMVIRSKHSGIVGSPSAVIGSASLMTFSPSKMASAIDGNCSGSASKMASTISKSSSAITMPKSNAGKLRPESGSLNTSGIELSNAVSNGLQQANVIQQISTKPVSSVKSKTRMGTPRFSLDAGKISDLSPRKTTSPFITEKTVHDHGATDKGCTVTAGMSKDNQTGGGISNHFPTLLTNLGNPASDEKIGCKDAQKLRDQIDTLKDQLKNSEADSGMNNTRPKANYPIRRRGEAAASSDNDTCISVDGNVDDEKRASTNDRNSGEKPINIDTRRCSNDSSHSSHSSIRSLGVVGKKTDQRLRVILMLGACGLLTAGLGSLAYFWTGLTGVWGIGIDSLQVLFDFHKSFPMPKDDGMLGDKARHLEASSSVGNNVRKLAGGEVEMIENRQPDFQTCIVFFICKLIAFVLCAAVGGPGGILMPSLIIGGFFGGGMLSIFEKIIHPALYAVLWQPAVIFGVIGLFSAVFRFPLTSVVILFELTGFDPGTWLIALPCILCSFISIATCDSLYDFPALFDGLCEQDGISLYGMRWDLVMQNSPPDEYSGHYDEYEIYENGSICDNGSVIRDNGSVYDKASVYDSASVYDNASVVDVHRISKCGLSLKQPDRCPRSDYRSDREAELEWDSDSFATASAASGGSGGITKPSLKGDKSHDNRVGVAAGAATACYNSMIVGTIPLTDFQSQFASDHRTDVKPSSSFTKKGTVVTAGKGVAGIMNAAAFSLPGIVPNTSLIPGSVPMLGNPEGSATPKRTVSWTKSSDESNSGENKLRATGNRIIDRTETHRSSENESQVGSAAGGSAAAGSVTGVSVRSGYQLPTPIGSSRGTGHQNYSANYSNHLNSRPRGSSYTGPGHLASEPNFNERRSVTGAKLENTLTQMWKANSQHRQHRPNNRKASSITPPNDGAMHWGMGESPSCGATHSGGGDPVGATHTGRRMESLFC